MHPEALSEKSERIFPYLTAFDNFILAGGTALALQIGHRVSVDFDFLSDEPIDKKLLTKVKKVFLNKETVLSVNNPDELTVFVDGVKLTFIYYPFLLGEERVNYQGVNLLPVKEIAASKAYTIGRRGSFRDYVGLYFVFAEGHASIKEIIELAEKKFGNEFNACLFLEQLVYLKDIEDTGVIFLKNAATKEATENFFVVETEKINL